MGNKNKEKTREYLIKALSVASDFNMFEVRQSIKTAIAKLDHLQEKQIKRDSIQEGFTKTTNIYQENDGFAKTANQVSQANYRNLRELAELQKQTLSAIDKLIKNEEDKIKNMKSQYETPNDDELFND